MHALVSYPFANQCWRQRGALYQNGENNSFDRWLKHMFDKTKKDDH